MSIGKYWFYNGEIYTVSIFGWTVTTIIKMHDYIIVFVRPLYILSREWRVIVDRVQTNFLS